MVACFLFSFFSPCLLKRGSPLFFSVAVGDFLAFSSHVEGRPFPGSGELLQNVFFLSASGNFPSG